MFFSEEKNQKTFDFTLADKSRPWPTTGVATLAVLRRFAGIRTCERMT
jgi:hypothetical protein